MHGRTSVLNGGGTDFGGPVREAAAEVGILVDLRCWEVHAKLRVLLVACYLLCFVLGLCSSLSCVRLLCCAVLCCAVLRCAVLRASFLSRRDLFFLLRRVVVYVVAVACLVCCRHLDTWR